MNVLSLKGKLKRLAKETGKTFNELWSELVLERFLARLSMSAFHDKLIFKGGLLLGRYIELGRETRDLDFLAKSINATEQKIKEALVSICSEDPIDNFVFELDRLEVLDHLHMNYPGFRAKLLLSIDNMKDSAQIDIGIGDKVDEVEYEISLSNINGIPLFEGEISLRVYPMESIFSEKIEAMISRGEANSRMKDFHDAYLMVKSGVIDGDRCKSALVSTFSTRKTEFETIAYSELDIELKQKQWETHLKKLGRHKKNLGLPVNFKEIITEINRFLIALFVEKDFQSLANQLKPLAETPDEEFVQYDSKSINRMARDSSKD